MTIEEIINQVGIESIQEQLQELISDTVYDDEVLLEVEGDGEILYFICSFPEGSEENTIVNMMPYSFKLSDDNYIKDMFNFLAYSADEDYKNDCLYKTRFDSHQINYCLRMANLIKR